MWSLVTELGDRPVQRTQGLHTAPHLHMLCSLRSAAPTTPSPPHRGRTPFARISSDRASERTVALKNHSFGFLLFFGRIFIWRKSDLLTAGRFLGPFRANSIGRNHG